MRGTDDGGAFADRDVVNIDLGDGMVVPVEVAFDSSLDFAGGRKDAGFRDWVDGGRRATLDQAAPTIKGMASWVQSQLAEVDTLTPDRVVLEMGIKFIAQSPGLVAPVLGQVGGEASLLVRLEWDVDRNVAQRVAPRDTSSGSADEGEPPSANI